MKSKKKSRLSIQKFVTVILICILLLSIIKIGNIFASTELFNIKNVEISEKTEEVELNSLSYEGNTISSDITFHKLWDSAKYKITIANNENEKYTVKSIVDDNSNEYVKYEYGDYTGTKLDANGEAIFEFTVKYANQINDLSKRIQSCKVTFTFTLESEKGEIKEEKIIIGPTSMNNPTVVIGSAAKTENKEKPKDNTDVVKESQPVNINTENVNKTEAKNDNVKSETKIEETQTKAEQVTTNTIKASEETVAKTSNPKTGDDIATYVTTAFTSLIILILMPRRKKISHSKIKRYQNKKRSNNRGFKTFGFFLALTLTIPVISRAVDNTSVITPQNTYRLYDRVIVTTIIDENRNEIPVNYNEIVEIEEPSKDDARFDGWELEDGTDFDTNEPLKEDVVIKARFIPNVPRTSVLRVKDKGAVFDLGTNVNIKMKKLAGDTDISDTKTENITIKAIKMAEEEPTEENKNEENIVSAENSPEPIYMWFDNGTIYWWSADDTPALNEDASAMFRHMSNLTDISGLEYFDTKNTRSFFVLFANDLSMTDYTAIKHWNTDNLRCMRALFQANKSLTSMDFTTFSWDTSKVESLQNLFISCTNLKSVNFGNDFSTSSLNNIMTIFQDCINLTHVDFGDNFDTSRVTSIRWMFNGCENLETIDLGNKFDTSNVTDMGLMFQKCKKLKHVNLGNKFDTSKVTDMGYMFTICNSLESIELGDKFDTSNVTNMTCMFNACESLTEINLGDKFDTSKVNDMNLMFRYCKSLTKLDLGNKFNTGNVTCMIEMFRGVTGISSLDISSFDMSSVTTATRMLDGMTSLKELKTPKVYSNTASLVINLPTTLSDGQGTEYTKLSSTSPKQTWLRKSFTVVFNSNGGTGTMDNQFVLFGVPTELTQNSFVKEKCKFKEWNTKADGKGTKFADKAQVSELAQSGEVNLYAIWEAELPKIGDVVNYTTTLNGQTLDKWKVFLVDGDYTYIILDDYLNNSAVNVAGLEMARNYSVYSESSRKTFINALTTKSNWDSLLTGTINGNTVNEARTSNVWAIGTPTLELWTRSWNTSNPNDKVYIAQTAEAMLDGLNGYYVGENENPTGFGRDLKESIGYNNSVYFPYQCQTTDACNGYWLASPSAGTNYSGFEVVSVWSTGNLSYQGCDYRMKAIRPVVCLPTSVINQ